MLKIVSGVSLIMLLTAGELFFLTFGFLLFNFPVFGFNIFPEYFGTLIVIMVLSQIILAVLAWTDFRQRIWRDDIKGALWEKLFSFGWLNYWFLMFTIAYVLIIFRGDKEYNWWNARRHTSFLFRVITKRSILDILSKFNVIQGPFFILVLVLGIIGVVVEIKSFDLLLLALKLGALWFIFVLNLAGLFQFLMLFHIVSRTWTDYSYEEFFTARMLFLPGIELKNYYYKIMRRELDE